MKNQRTDNESRLKELRSKRMALIALAIALGGTPVLTAGCSNTQTAIEETTERNEKKHKKSSEETETQIAKKYEEVTEDNLKDVLDHLVVPELRRSKYKILDGDIINMTKLQEEILDKLCGTITKYHELTHKENNFRLEEDGDYYLDFYLPELLSLDLMINDYSQEELNEIMGRDGLTKEDLNIYLSNLSMNLMVYYMTAKEPSGISEFIKDEDKKELFERIEGKALKLNKNYSEEKMQDFLSEDIVKAVFNQDKEALEKMDFETLLSAIPAVAVAQSKLADHYESRDITKTYDDALHVVIDDKATKIAEQMTVVEKTYDDKYAKTEEKIAKNEEKEVKKLKEEVEEKFKKVYGTDLKEYMSDEDLDSYLKDIYEILEFDKTFGEPLSATMPSIKYDLLEGPYAYSEGRKMDDVAQLHLIRLNLFDKELMNKKQSYNDKEEDGKEIVAAKVKTLKR